MGLASSMGEDEKEQNRVLNLKAEMDSSLNDIIRKKRIGDQARNNSRGGGRGGGPTGEMIDVRDKIIAKRKENLKDARQAIVSRKISRVKDARVLIQERGRGGGHVAPTSIKPKTDLRQKIELTKLASATSAALAQGLPNPFGRPPPSIPSIGGRTVSASPLYIPPPVQTQPPSVVSNLPSLMDVVFSKPPPTAPVTTPVPTKIHAKASFFPDGIPDVPTLIRRTMTNANAAARAKQLSASVVEDRDRDRDPHRSLKSRRRTEYVHSSEEDLSPPAPKTRAVEPARLALVVDNPSAKGRSQTRPAEYERQKDEDEDEILPPVQRKTSSREMTVRTRSPLPSPPSSPPPKSTSTATSKSERAPLTTASLRSSVTKGSTPVPSSYVRVSNLHEDVSRADIHELFMRVGRVVRANLIKPGIAEVYFVTSKEAAAAVSEYHERLLDGLPMEVKIVAPPAKRTNEERRFAPPDVSTIHLALSKMNKAKANDLGDSNTRITASRLSLKLRAGMFAGAKVKSSSSRPQKEPNIRLQENSEDYCAIKYKHESA
ncbi:unnamed protein product [Cyprideis torosa]|uniref:Uncharacterized protein n=1 Tax=Cyprideis torosa TaxID=163714 RepID=A0A7R8WF70_9CRUS|nr:unnamed protein product [Cyprideis torosa]CAG0890592.1 unnamed protein product [Cyprideis torosa]